ncbi:hypothetical protein [Thermoactinomyces mirandus]|uniref:Uncharacterized protein n=1 Tax=Thermoactinomyces mirandus TaxID=2756294 RepID=A0A7W1XSC6_9BACL|nr:hypothetical protein [Thermoactinomyces mirandus]MBA4602246.1 hypothetical protein [Thermoactinomyces mirandus]
MELIAFFLLALFIIISIMVNVSYRSAKKVPHKQRYDLPDLGIRRDSELEHSLKKLVHHLENALAESYIERAKERVIREHKISIVEWENRFFEWKRYIIMKAILKNAPAYSTEVDETWQEMQMFTREYDEFCRCYLKTPLTREQELPVHPGHHEERAWFDFVYVLLFCPTKYSYQAWGDFFKHPLPKSLLEDFKRCTNQELAGKYFNPTSAESEIALVIHGLIRDIKHKLEQVDQYIVNHGTDVRKFRRQYRKYVSKTGKGTDDVTSGVIFLSLYYQESFAEKYNYLYDRGSSASYGSAVDYPFAGHGDSGSGDGGGDGGGGE